VTGRWARPTRRTLIAACWSIGITLATATYLALVYPTLPGQLPVRYVRGEPVFFQLKTPLVVMLPALVQAALALVFGSLSLLLLLKRKTRNEERKTDDENLAAENDLRMRTAVEGIALLGAVWISVQAIGAARLVVSWQDGRGGFGRVYNLTLLIAFVASAVIVWRTMRALRAQPQTPADSNPAVWRLTHLYVNPADPALFVPTRRGVGWTLNFGRPLAIVLIAAILMLGVGGPFLLARSVLWDGAFVLLQIR
jgi:uncharacterized membrane protein